MLPKYPLSTMCLYHVISQKHAISCLDVLLLYNALTNGSSNLSHVAWVSTLHYMSMFCYISEIRYILLRCYVAL